MILGIGIDHVDVPRFDQLLKRHGDRLRHRVFTPGELELADESRTTTLSLAARFAAKEAAMKALGTGWTRGVSFLDFEVWRTRRGGPTLKITGEGLKLARQRGVTRAWVSLSHTQTIAMAVVVLEGDATQVAPPA